MLISTKQRQPVLKNLDQKLSLDIRDHELEVVEKNRYSWLANGQFSRLEMPH